MPTYEDARNIILNSVTLLGMEQVALLDSLGRVIGEDMVAPWDMPYFDNSAMDGFAVRATDCRDRVNLRITGYIPAGGTATIRLASMRAIGPMGPSLAGRRCW